MPKDNPQDDMVEMITWTKLDPQEDRVLLDQIVAARFIEELKKTDMRWHQMGVPMNWWQAPKETGDAQETP